MSTDPNLSSDLTREHSNAYMQLVELQTKLSEDDCIISMLQQDSADHNAAIVIIETHRKELNRELRKVKKRIAAIEEKWRG